MPTCDTCRLKQVAASVPHSECTTCRRYRASHSGARRPEALVARARVQSQDKALGRTPACDQCQTQKGPFVYHAVADRDLRLCHDCDWDADANPAASASVPRRVSTTSESSVAATASPAPPTPGPSDPRQPPSPLRDRQPAAAASPCVSDTSFDDWPSDSDDGRPSPSPAGSIASGLSAPSSHGGCAADPDEPAPSSASPPLVPTPEAEEETGSNGDREPADCDGELADCDGELADGDGELADCDGEPADGDGDPVDCDNDSEPTTLESSQPGSEPADHDDQSGQAERDLADHSDNSSQPGSEPADSDDQTRRPRSDSAAAMGSPTPSEASEWESAGSHTDGGGQGWPRRHASLRDSPDPSDASEPVDRASAALDSQPTLSAASPPAHSELDPCPSPRVASPVASSLQLSDGSGPATRQAGAAAASGPALLAGRPPTPLDLDVSSDVSARDRVLAWVSSIDGCSEASSPTTDWSVEDGTRDLPAGMPCPPEYLPVPGPAGQASTSLPAAVPAKGGATVDADHRASHSEAAAQQASQDALTTQAPPRPPSPSATAPRVGRRRGRTVRQPHRARGLLKAGPRPATSESPRVARPLSAPEPEPARPTPPAPPAGTPVPTRRPRLAVRCRRVLRSAVMNN